MALITPSETTTKKTGISAPWVTKAKEIITLFAKDTDLDVTFKEETNTVIIESTNTYKIMALEKILKKEFTFGNVTLKVECLVKNEKESMAALFKTAFAGNPHISQIQEVTTPMSPSETYVVFKKEVLQFFNDDISDFYGNWNGLAEDIIRDLVNENVRANFSTEIHEPETDA